MPDNRSRRDVAPGRSARQARLLVSLVVLASATIGAAASTGTSPRAAARALPAQVALRAAASTAQFRGDDFARAGTRAEVLAAETASGAALPRPVVHTMSMDAPIQGGLTAHQEQALSARLVSAHGTAAAAPTAEYWSPAMGRSAVARAESWLGMPYSWAGGDSAGPTPGVCAPGTGGDLDCHVVGFDCSGLMMYAWGAYASLPHLAAAQRGAGAFHPTVKQLLPGDLVFFAGYLPGGTGHVAIYAGGGMVIEAPQSGSVVKRSALADLISEDGYRGAVRPLTGQTPTLTAPRSAVPADGGTVTLRGTHLAGVDAVHLDSFTVRRFTQQSDSTIVFRAPAHHDGMVAVTVSTSWAARSKSINLTYTKPRPAPIVTAPTAPVTAPTTPVTSPTEPVTSPTKPVTPPVTSPSPPVASPTAPTTPSSPPSESGAPAPQPSTASSAPAG